jgi:hypothetical protein
LGCLLPYLDGGGYMRTVEQVEKEIELLKDKVDKLQDQLIDGEIDAEMFSVEIQKLISIKRTLRWVIEDLSTID